MLCLPKKAILTNSISEIKKQKTKPDHLKETDHDIEKCFVLKLSSSFLLGMHEPALHTSDSLTSPVIPSSFTIQQVLSPLAPILQEPQFQGLENC